MSDSGRPVSPLFKFKPVFDGRLVPPGPPRVAPRIEDVLPRPKMVVDESVQHFIPLPETYVDGFLLLPPPTAVSSCPQFKRDMT